MAEHIICNGESPDQRMTAFIGEHHVMTLSTVSGENIPWCASCFYTYIEDRNYFVFTTDDETRHGREMLHNPVVAACIALETRVTGRIRGVQITGVARKVSATEKKWAAAAFIRKFPVAILKQTQLWILEPHHIKMTDNRLGFGKKLLWAKGDQQP